MMTLWGEGRGFRVAWLLEEMGLSYQVRPVDLLVGVENDPEFLAINPAGFIPALQDGDTTMVESIAILQYLAARYGPTALAPSALDPEFAAYLQFLHLGEAGLAAPANLMVIYRHFAPETERDAWGAHKALEMFENRLRLVSRQLETNSYIAGARFTISDISVTYALQLAERAGGFIFGELESDYIARTSSRPAYKRAMDACHGTRGWVEQVEAERRRAASAAADG